MPLSDRCFSDAATAYLTARAIDPAAARACGVRERNGMVVWPTVDADGAPSPRYRRLKDGPGPKCRGARGRTLGVWWPRGRPDAPGDVLVCEGESDAMAAVCALNDESIAVAALPGASFPSRVLVRELRMAGASVAALAFDGDLAGGNAADRVAWDLVEQGIGARILAIPYGEDLASTLAQCGSGCEYTGGPESAADWLRAALLSARPVGLEVAALRAETAWLRSTCLDLCAQLKGGVPAGELTEGEAA